ncbi:metallophosphoesterase family protein [Paracoccus sp. NGMCC 1.201697]|uniref:Metallophosphoesterase family protein n=1 Tax=Paracoccus broussonetiae subsp. drimophilus TaxID=3373869 RepID=A0ABW7LS12_9RHOB
MQGTLAVISDIHGNVDALRAVLEDIQTQGIHRIVNLGDHLSGPLAAAETADVLMDGDFICIRGNHDRQLVELEPGEMGISDRAAHAQLRPAHLEWLRGLPPVLTLQDGIFLCHGTPRSDTTYWLEMVLPVGHAGLQNEASVAAELQGTASLFLCGHTHIPRRVDIGTCSILNPGSVGCPAYDDQTPFAHVMETGTCTASYATVRRTAAGWATSHHQVPYDPARMIRMAEAGGRPDWVQALLRGRVR